MKITRYSSPRNKLTYDKGISAPAEIPFRYMERNMKKTGKIILWVMFAVYAAVMLFLLFFERIGVYYPSDLSEYLLKVWHNTQLVPFLTISEFIMSVQSFSVSDPSFRNLAGNVVLFIPLGFFLSLLIPKLRKFMPFILTFVLVILCVELIQAFTLLGSCDIDDLILNTAGGCIGYLITAVIRSKHFLRLRGSVQNSDER